ncbi:chaperone binding protein, putative [Plasmodium reichenowi]|uniref:Chaperone binding protein, putative n=1 Tax=Plasmodium reichenowi TaxID=5854 RepID=A0A060RXD8_PLARE|nr:chaperone binding protein, putative [Plasmodium reichenowi]KYN94776.1 chaperone binding protein, putative [Plasmodium reichenowi]CDO66133.1 chaperone binding protein, putative [Plasmodium reichenowi]SOV81978.1 chaperone binding protein, putative [Plasmodium reichenowi]
MVDDKNKDKNCSKKDEKNNKIDEDKEFDEKVKNMSFDDKVRKILDLKLEGNNDYKNKNYEKAINKYNEGMKYMKKIENKNEKIKELEIALYLNLSICYSNVEKYNEAYDNITKVLSLDKTNAKGMFRLCQIEFNRCNFDVAKDKIQEFIKIYPDNIEAKKLLKNIILKQNEHNKKQKEAFSKIFEKASGLYDDREKEIMRKKKEKYEKEMKERKEKNEDIIKFEEWEILDNEKRIKEDEEKRKEKEKEREKQNEKEKQKQKEMEKKNKNKNDSLMSSSTTNNNSSYLDIDEEDQKIINETKKMGYCYFKKDIKEDDKKFFEKNIPKKIDTTNYENSNTLYNNQNNKAISSWNAAGTTYEEKDMTKWAKNKIEECLKNIHFKNDEDSDSLNLNNQNGSNFSSVNYPHILPIQYLSKIQLNDVKNLSVDAQIVVIRGTKRHIFELSCNLDITIFINITELHVHKVLVEIKELSSELEAGKTWKNFITIKKNDKLKIPDNLFNDIYDFVIEKVQEQIKNFTQEYNKM